MRKHRKGFYVLKLSEDHRVYVNLQFDGSKEVVIYADIESRYEGCSCPWCSGWHPVSVAPLAEQRYKFETVKTWAEKAIGKKFPGCRKRLAKVGRSA